MKEQKSRNLHHTKDFVRFNEELVNMPVLKKDVMSNFDKTSTYSSVKSKPLTNKTLDMLSRTSKSFQRPNRPQSSYKSGARSLVSSVVKENRKIKRKLEGAQSLATTVKTLDILRLINGVNRAAEKSMKIEALLKQAQEENETQIDDELL